MIYCLLLLGFLVFMLCFFLLWEFWYDEKFIRISVRSDLKVDSSKDDLCLLLPNILDHYNLEQLLPWSFSNDPGSMHSEYKSLKMLASVCELSQKIFSPSPFSIVFAGAWKAHVREVILFHPFSVSLILLHSDFIRNPLAKHPTLGQQWALSSIYDAFDSTLPGSATIFKMKVGFSTLLTSLRSCFHLIFAFKSFLLICYFLNACVLPYWKERDGLFLFVCLLFLKANRTSHYSNNYISF